jgi:hypothetical protein
MFNLQMGSDHGDQLLFIAKYNGVATLMCAHSLCDFATEFRDPYEKAEHAVDCSTFKVTLGCQMIA